MQDEVHLFVPFGLDIDNISCDPAVADPMDLGGGGFEGGFCTPENINLDSPKTADAFCWH